MAGMALGEEAAQVGVAFGVRDVEEDARASFGAVKRQLAADDKADARLFGGLEGAHHPIKAVAIGDAEGVVPELGSTREEGLRGGASPEEREVTAGSKLDEHCSGEQYSCSRRRGEGEEPPRRQDARREGIGPLTFLSWRLGGPSFLWAPGGALIWS